MPIYLYRKGQNYYISLYPIPNKCHKKLEKYKGLNIENNIYLNYPNDSKTHILNTILVPTRLGTIVIINKKTLECRHFGKFDVLKDYKIQQDELSFVVFYINNAIKIHSGRFDIRESYKICSTCYNSYIGEIKTCSVCGAAICNRCEISSESKICVECKLFIESSSDEDELFNTILMEI